MTEEQRQIATVAGAFGVLVLIIVVFFVAPDPLACEQAKKALSQHVTRSVGAGLSEQMQRLRRDRETALYGGSYSSALDDLIAELRQSRRDSTRKQTRAQLRRERDAACSWF